MPHLFQLGPVPTSQGDAWIVCGLDEGGLALRPCSAATRGKALRAALKELDPAAAVRCEPALADLAGPLGLAVAPLDPDSLELRAVLAFSLACGQVAPDPNPAVAAPFFEACRHFWKQRPWEAMVSDVPMELELRVDGERVLREVSVMGAAGEVFGLALYDLPGSMDRLLAASDRRDRAAARRIDNLSVSFDEEPRWAAAAWKDAFGDPRVPRTMRLRRGKPVAPTRRELAELTAALIVASEHLARKDPMAGPTVVRLDVGPFAIEARATLSGEPMPEDLLGLEDGDDDERDDGPELVVRPSEALRRDRIPRNGPCPCGSGRKYKKCHLAEDEARAAAARKPGPEGEPARAEARRLAERDPVHDLDERITADARALARRRWGNRHAPERALAALGVPLDHLGFLDGWQVAHHRGPDGRTALDLYVDERGAGLDDLGRRLVEAQRRAWFAPLEVVGVVPGVSLVLRDLLEGGIREVRERTASQSLVAHNVVLARVLELGDHNVLGGLYPQALPPLEADGVRRALRKAMKVRGEKKPVPPEKLREATAEGLPIACWLEGVRALASRTVTVENSDGEEMLFTVDRFEVTAGREAAVREALLALPGAERAGDGRGDALEVVFLGGKRDPSTVVGAATLRGRTLRLESSSAARADRLRALVTGAAGAHLTFRARELQDPLAQLGEARAPDPRTSRPAEVPAHVARALREYEHGLKLRWLDEEVPALGGLTPRAAVRRKGEPRRRLALLLDQFESMEARRPEAERFDVGILRRELGIEG